MENYDSIASFNSMQRDLLMSLQILSNEKMFCTPTSDFKACIFSKNMLPLDDEKLVAYEKKEKKSRISTWSNVELRPSVPPAGKKKSK